MICTDILTLIANDDIVIAHALTDPSTSPLLVIMHFEAGEKSARCLTCPSLDDNSLVHSLQLRCDPGPSYRIDGLVPFYQDNQKFLSGFNSRAHSERDRKKFEPLHDISGPDISSQLYRCSG